MIKGGRAYSKKGEAITQPFVFIIIIVIMAFTIFFGAKMVMNLVKVNDKVIYTEFKSQLTEAVNNAYNANPGTTFVFSKESRNYKPLRVPKGAGKVCITNNDVDFDYEVNSKNRYAKFTVDKLKGNGCIDVTSGAFSFTLKNTILSGGREVAVLITKNG